MRAPKKRSNLKKIIYLWRGPFNEVVDEGPLFVTDHHPGPLVRLQPQGLQGELLQEVDPGIPGLAQKFHLTLIYLPWL